MGLMRWLQLHILKHMCEKYVFTYDDAKMLELAQAMKTIVDDTSHYPDWNNRDDIKAQLKMDLIRCCTNLASRPWPMTTFIKACWNRR